MSRREDNRVVQASLCFVIFAALVSGSYGYRTWVCNNGSCVKTSTSDFSKSVSVQECKVTCLKFAGLWPQPTHPNHIGKEVVQVEPRSIQFFKDALPEETSNLVESAQRILLERIRLKTKSAEATEDCHYDRAYKIRMRIDIYDPTIKHFTTYTDESYKLRVKADEEDRTVNVMIGANNFFGARHALETVNQLIFFDDLHKVTKMLAELDIEDGPAFTYRGIILDTSRSYIGVEMIKKIIDAMSLNKLNTFHWHITDTHSFPYVSRAYPELSREGAYSESQVYTPCAIKEIVEFARVRGVRVIPEFDAPAHVGEGWEALGKDLVTCFKWEPWRTYCVEPPCGQFDPTNEAVYEIVGNIFKEYAELFPSDLFHMGGDEVNTYCWESTPRIVNWMKENNYTIDHDGFHKLWLRFQDKMYAKLKSARSDPHPTPILWSSSLTELKDVEQYLNPDEYIIQIWYDKDDMNIKTLLRKKYRLIMSNYDELYLDCGGPSWVGEAGTNWCSPYKGWQVIYNHDLVNMAPIYGLSEYDLRKQILGSEVALWTEQIDESAALSRIWPRAAALAERLWSNPSQDWRDAQFRMNHHRERLRENMAQPELLQPQWCYQNDGYCA